jgi:hypothetical protein
MSRESNSVVSVKCTTVQRKREITREASPGAKQRTWSENEMRDTCQMTETKYLAGYSFSEVVSSHLCSTHSTALSCWKC